MPDLCFILLGRPVAPLYVKRAGEEQREHSQAQLFHSGVRSMRIPFPGLSLPSSGPAVAWDLSTPPHAPISESAAREESCQARRAGSGHGEEWLVAYRKGLKELGALAGCWGLEFQTDSRNVQGGWHEEGGGQIVWDGRVGDILGSGCHHLREWPQKMGQSQWQ